MDVRDQVVVVPLLRQAQREVEVVVRVADVTAVETRPSGQVVQVRDSCEQPVL
jgi:hypothetical protein